MQDLRASQRRDLLYAASGFLRLHEYQGRFLGSNPALIRVTNISLSGFRLSCPLAIPLLDSLLVSIDVTLFGRQHRLIGSLVWCEASEDQFVYGFRIASVDAGYLHSISPFLRQTDTFRMLPYRPFLRGTAV